MTTSVGQIYGQTLAIVKERFGSLLGLWAAFFAINLVLIVVFAMIVGVSAFAGAAAQMESGALGAGAILGAIVFYFAYILVYCAQSASMTAMASPLQRLSFSEAMSAGFRSALPMLGLIVILLIAYFLAALVVGLIIGILSFAGAAGAFLGMAVVAIGATYLVCRLCTVNAVIAVERVGNPLTALARGWNMTRGNALTIFLALLGFGVIAAVLILIVAAPLISTFTAAASLSAGDPMAAPPEMPGIGSMAFFGIGALIVGLLLAISGAALMSVIHGELSDASPRAAEEVFA